MIRSRFRPANPASRTRSVARHLLSAVRREHGRQAIFNLKDKRFAQMRDFFLHGVDPTTDGFDPVAALGEGWKEVRDTPSGTQAYELQKSGSGSRQRVTVSMEDVRLTTEAQAGRKRSIQTLTVDKEGRLDAKHHWS